MVYARFAKWRDGNTPETVFHTLTEDTVELLETLNCAGAMCWQTGLMVCDPFGNTPQSMDLITWSRPKTMCLVPDRWTGICTRSGIWSSASSRESSGFAGLLPDTTNWTPLSWHSFTFQPLQFYCFRTWLLIFQTRPNSVDFSGENNYDIKVKWN